MTLATAVTLEERTLENLSAELRRLRDMEGITFTTLSNMTGISRPAISQIANQRLRMRPEQEQKIWAAINEIKASTEKAETTQLAMPGTFKNRVELYETKEYKEAIGWCAYIFNKRKMGVMVGHPGSGKTTILRQFSKLQPGVLYIEAWPSMRLNDLLETIGRELGLTLRGNNYKRTQALIAALKDRTDVLIAIDEAEYLRKWDVDKFEALRKIWDNTGTPVLLCGTMVLEDLLTRGAGRDNLAQLYRRKVELKLKGIAPGEAKEILRDYNVAADVLEPLAAIAGDVKHGGMGTFVEILELCLEAAQGGQITAAILASAKKYKLMY